MHACGHLSHLIHHHVGEAAEHRVARHAPQQDAGGGKGEARGLRHARVHTHGVAHPRRGPCAPRMHVFMYIYTHARQPTAAA